MTTIRKFERLISIAAPLLENAIDTDVIFPARFLLLLDREGLGKYAFHERRNGDEPFVLDTPPYKKAEILVTRENFGTGSSREQAVWALADTGIRCIIARSFGEIFHANCFKNGVLAISLSEADIGEVETAASAATEIAVDLERQMIELPSGRSISFDIDPYRKRSLLKGLDEVGMILAEELDAIAAFESNREKNSPWMTIDAGKLASLANV